MRPQIILAVFSILTVLAPIRATLFSSLTDQDVKEIARFAITTHNQWVPLHRLKLVRVDKFESTVLVPNVSSIYKLVLTTNDVVGIVKQRYVAVVKVYSLNSSGRGFKQLLSFLPKLI